MKNSSKNKSLINAQDLCRRPRRLRQNKTIRDAVSETDIKLSQLVKPLFIQDDPKKSEIKSMPGQFRFNVVELLKEIEFSMKHNVSSFALFPVIDSKKKNAIGTEAFAKNNLIATTILKIKKEFPECVLYADVALDPYTEHGHDGYLKNGKILNDESVELLIKQAILMAQVGADFVSPSDMMDGRIGAIRKALDKGNYINTGILSYTAKYASSFYGPFREALSSAPKSGDKKTYQMDFRNKKEAIVEAELDYDEGADILMVKPAMAYLDIIHLLKENFPIPIAAFQVSGEYSMIKFASLAGVIDEEKAIFESLVSIKRAGADIIFTYFTNELITILKNK